MIRYLVPVLLLILAFATMPAFAADPISSVDLENECYAWLLDSVSSDQRSDLDEFTYLQPAELTTYDFLYSPATSAVASDAPAPKGNWSKAVRSSNKFPAGALAGVLALAGVGAGGLGGGGGAGVTVSLGGDRNADEHTGSGSIPPIPAKKEGLIGPQEDSFAPVSDSSSLILFGITALPFVISRFRPRR